MFELAGLIGTPEKSIIVQTRRGTSIANAQSPDPDPSSRRRYELLRSKHSSWRQRRGAVGTYNCFGHVWASRRTAIYEEAQLQTLLAEDGYRQVPVGTHPWVGDIALYRKTDMAAFTRAWW